MVSVEQGAHPLGSILAGSPVRGQKNGRLTRHRQDRRHRRPKCWWQRPTSEKGPYPFFVGTVHEPSTAIFSRKMGVRLLKKAEKGVRPLFRFRGDPRLTSRGNLRLMWQMDAIEAATILARARQGDSDAFRVLVEEHSRAVFRLAYRMTGNEQDAEDVVQESFLR